MASFLVYRETWRALEVGQLELDLYWTNPVATRVSPVHVALGVGQLVGWDRAFQAAGTLCLEEMA